MTAPTTSTRIFTSSGTDYLRIPMKYILTIILLKAKMIKQNVQQMYERTFWFTYRFDFP